jgi:four helix bundle protein
MANAVTRPDAALAEWEAQQLDAVKGDPIWRLHCFREALFLVELVRDDVRKFDRAGADEAAQGQLLRAVGSIAANLAEGYGRPTAADRVRFFSYALGSAREAMTWYRLLRSSDDAAMFSDRLERLARICRMLVGLLTRIRDRTGRKFESW